MEAIGKIWAWTTKCYTTVVLFFALLFFLGVMDGGTFVIAFLIAMAIELTVSHVYIAAFVRERDQARSADAGNSNERPCS